MSFTLRGALGTYKEFRKKYEINILRGRDSLATEDERILGGNTLSELTHLANKFIIRRTANFLLNYRRYRASPIRPHDSFQLLCNEVPPKYDYVVFCSLSEHQKLAYKKFINSENVRSLISETPFQPLKSITYLKKLCNHPNLVDTCGPSTSKKFLNRNSAYSESKFRLSGKLLALHSIITELR